jgi:DNA-binding transcriptional MerR regulator
MAYSTFDTAKILGVTRSSIQQWMNCGYIAPSLEQSVGRGSKNFFSKDDIYRIEMFRILSLAGIPQKEAGKLKNKFNFDVVAKNPEKYRYGVVFYRKSGNSGKKISLGYLSQKGRIKDDGPPLRIILDLVQIKAEVDREIREYEDSKR